MPRSSASRSPSRRRSRSSRSRSIKRSPSPVKRGSRSRSRSRRRTRTPPSPRGRRSRSGPRRSRSPPRRYDNKTNAPPNRCIGVFGLSLSTREETLIKLFDRYPGFESVKLVKEFATGRSRGFAFITYESKDDAAYAREKCNGQDIDGHPVRIDFSANDMRKRPFRSPPRFRRRSRSRSIERRRSISRSPPRRRY